MTAAELIHPMSGLWAWLPVLGAVASSVLWPAAWNAGRIVRSWWKEKAMSAADGTVTVLAEDGPR